MIKYALQCEKAHSFESWFPSMTSYETQAKRGFVECPHCGSTHVEKQIMAPTIRLGGIRADKEPLTAAPAVQSEEAKPATTLEKDSEAAQKLRVMMRELHEHVKANTEDVGTKFADVARKIHYGEVEERGIRGRASADEVQELAEEGISFLPLPPLPEDRN
jgi:hypothetical protein